MAWWSRTQGLAEQPKKSVPKGIWTKCERCNSTLYEDDLVANFRVCTGCQHHFRVPTDARIEMMVDPGSWQEHDRGLESGPGRALRFRVETAGHMSFELEGEQSRSKLSIVDGRVEAMTLRFGEPIAPMRFEVSFEGFDDPSDPAVPLPDSEGP